MFERSNSLVYILKKEKISNKLFSNFKVIVLYSCNYCHKYFFLSRSMHNTIYSIKIDV